MTKFQEGDIVRLITSDEAREKFGETEPIFKNGVYAHREKSYISTSGNFIEWVKFNPEGREGRIQILNEQPYPPQAYRMLVNAIVGGYSRCVIIDSIDPRCLELIRRPV